MSENQLPWHSDDFRALLAAVAHDPVEDTPRLALADWLGEWASEVGEVECGACEGHGYKHWDVALPYPSSDDKCPTCSGRGTVPNVCGLWSELIRVQVELARMRPPHKKIFDMGGEGRVLFKSRGGPDYYEFTMARPGEVQAGDRIDFLSHRGGVKKAKLRHGLRVVKTGEWNGPNNPSTAIVCRDEESKPWPGDSLRSRESHLLPLVAPAVMLGPKCERCGGKKRSSRNTYGWILLDCPSCSGTGHTGPLASILPTDVTWRRGFPTVVKVPTLSVAWNIERDEPSEWAMRVARDAGWVEELVARDRMPADRLEVNGEMYWFRNHRNSLGHWADENHLPDALFDKLDGATPDTIGLPFDSPAAAASALGRAVVQAARERVGKVVTV